MPYFSPSTGGFYFTDLHGDAMPSDVVKISKAKHEALLAAQAGGASIVAGPRGPVAKLPKASATAELERARRRVSLEAKRRIRAIATLEQQANDNAALAMAALHIALEGATEVDFVPAADRRRAIDAVRAAAGKITASLDAMNARELASFNVAACSSWPESEKVA